MNQTARIAVLILLAIITFAGLKVLAPSAVLNQAKTALPEPVNDTLQQEGPTETMAMEPEVLYGFVVDSLVVEEDLVKSNQSLSDILLEYNLTHKDVFKLAHASKEVFDVRKFRAGAKYTIISEDDSVRKGVALVYEPDALGYVVFHLKDSLYAEKIEREVEIVERKLSGSITQSLSVTMDDLGITQELTNKFVDVLGWKIDFFSLQKGDRFKVIYREKVVEGTPVGIDGISAIQFEHWGNEYFAFEFDQGEGIDYFDKEGKSIRRALLRYPLEFSRISSRYSLSRFHPVQKRYKAHLGTDFAAATGTPIRAVGEGTIIEAGFKKNNGNYVKLRHNGTYTTQYLHMSKIANGIRAGVRVRQGQTIGYVGSTGLATGPHLCYRFWKNGVQVDALRVEIPPSHPVSEEHMTAYSEKQDELKQKLETIEWVAAPADPIVSIGGRTLISVRQ